MAPPLSRKTWLALGLVALVVGARLLGVDLGSGGDGVLTIPEPARTARSTATHDARGAERSALLERLVAERRSGVMVEAAGTIVALLPDDREGSRHQRLLVELPGGGTVLIAHNIDLAPRVDTARKDDLLEFRGQYEWNEKGGVIHWTHHDPDGRHDEGWLRHDGRTYR